MEKIVVEAIVSSEVSDIFIPDKTTKEEDAHGIQAECTMKESSKTTDANIKKIEIAVSTKNHEYPNETPDTSQEHFDSKEETSMVENVTDPTKVHNESKLYSEINSSPTYSDNYSPESPPPNYQPYSPVSPLSYYEPLSPERTQTYYEPISPPSPRYSYDASSPSSSQLYYVPLRPYTPETTDDSIDIQVEMSLAKYGILNHLNNGPTPLVYQLPNPAAKWGMFLEDLAKDRRKRTERIRRRSENVDEFMNRFPILEISSS